MGNPKRSYMLRSGGHGYSNRRAPLFPPLRRAVWLPILNRHFPVGVRPASRKLMLSNYPSYRQYQIGQVGAANLSASNARMHGNPSPYVCGLLHTMQPFLLPMPVVSYWAVATPSAA